MLLSGIFKLNCFVLFFKTQHNLLIFKNTLQIRIYLNYSVQSYYAPIIVSNIIKYFRYEYQHNMVQFGNKKLHSYHIAQLDNNVENGAKIQFRLNYIQQTFLLFHKCFLRLHFDISNKEKFHQTIIASTYHTP